MLNIAVVLPFNLLLLLVKPNNVTLPFSEKSVNIDIISEVNQDVDSRGRQHLAVNSCCLPPFNNARLSHQWISIHSIPPMNINAKLSWFLAQV